MPRCVRTPLLLLPAVAVVLGLLAIDPLLAAPSAQARTQVRAVEAAVKRAGNLYRTKKFTDAAAALDQADEGLAGLAEADAMDLAGPIDGIRKRIAKARDLLKAAGVEPAAPKSTAAGAPKSTSPGAPNAAPGDLSFTRHVAPLLVTRCGRCHVQNARGDFSMATYVSLSKGTKDGAVIIAGNGRGSRIVEVIASGDMPRGGGKVTPEELTLLTAWIDAGAKFDGPDSAAPLTSFTTSRPDGAGPKPTVVAANDKDEIQFARDLGSVFMEHCLDCHGEDNPRNQFSVDTFNRMLAGGFSGAALAPGKPDESLLVKKLRGQGGARMPLDRDPLDDATIAKIARWIELGAKFDGADPAASLADTVALTRALGATHEELRASRSELAAKNWRLVLPDSQPHCQETDNVLVYGTVGEELLSEVTQVADAQTARLAKFFKLPADRPLVKGRLTLFVFDKRYDYGEVGTMLERREIPASWRGHWRYTGVDAYGCVLLTDDQAPAGLIAQQIAGAYVASLGKVPRWFAEGTARAIAARVDAKDPRLKLWDDQVTRVLGDVDKPEEFLTGELAPEDADALAYSYVKYLMTSTNRYAGLLAALAEGTPFDAAFSGSYGGTPAQLVAAWRSRAAKRGR